MRHKDEDLLKAKGIGHIKRELGSGSFSKVKLTTYKATNGRETPVALKIIDLRTPESDDERKELKEKFLPRELEIQKSIKHQHIVQCFDSFTLNDKVYLVLEFCEGGDLLNYCTKQSGSCLKEALAQLYFRQILEALEHLHSEGIVHRDIKLENVMLNQKQDSVKISDFGFTRSVKGYELLDTFCGSLAYAAPELLQEEPYDGTKADTWSAGVLLHTMLYGTLPFDRISATRALKQQLSRRTNVPKQATSLSASVKDLLSKLLEPDATKRFSAKQALSHSWFNKDDDDNVSEISRTSVAQYWFGRFTKQRKSKGGEKPKTKKLPKRLRKADGVHQPTSAVTNGLWKRNPLACFTGFKFKPAFGKGHESTKHSCCANDENISAKENPLKQVASSSNDFSRKP